MAMNSSVPFKLLKEFLNRKVTVETSFGESYKGLLLEVEENMSVALSNVKAILADGRSVQMASVYIKGSRIRLINFPDSARDSIASLTRPPVYRGRGGLRGGRRTAGRRAGFH